MTEIYHNKRKCIIDTNDLDYITENPSRSSINGLPIGKYLNVCNQLSGLRFNLMLLYLCRLMKGYPNTYALSKILAEDLVHSFKDKLPIVITRPSIVASAWNEPFPGYVDGKKSGLAGILLTRGRGILRTLYSDPNNPLEIIPVDIANNVILALTCKRALMGGTDVLFSNLTNSNLIKWKLKEFFDYEMEVVREYPLDLTIWWPYCPLTRNKFYYEYRRFFYHKIPAHFGDFWIRVVGEKPL